MFVFAFILLFHSVPRAFSAQPPKVLLHIGQKQHLLADDAAGTIPQEVWENSIMGRNTRFGLVPYRRGLYGGEVFDELELYGNGYFGARDGKAKIPWVMKITVKDECRNGSTYSDLNEDTKWIGWVSSNLNQLVKEASFCLNPNAQSCAELIIGTQPIAQGREENICDDWMLKFMKDTKPRMVIDTEWPNSWYLRDRECIETIKALPKDVLEILAESKWDAKSRESTHSGTTGGYGMSAISMLFSALADTPQVDPSLMDRLKSKLANSDIRLHYQDPPRNWVRETGPALLSAYQRCLSGKKFDEFQKTEKAFVAILSSPDFSKEEGKDKAVNWLNRQLQSICSL